MELQFFSCLIVSVLRDPAQLATGLEDNNPIFYAYFTRNLLIENPNTYADY
jgi:hypothetical protein